MVDIAENKPHRHDHCYAKDADLDILRIDKIGAEEVPRQFAEIEDVRGPIDGKKE